MDPDDDENYLEWWDQSSIHDIEIESTLSKRWEYIPIHQKMTSRNNSKCPISLNVFYLSTYYCTCHICHHKFSESALKKWFQIAQCAGRNGRILLFLSLFNLNTYFLN